ncbi:translation initiation factor [Sphingobacterium corticis]|uniref:Translation initiation factor n=1 Tax=Sphingobacterium corticis TaxID=1812823 RepID=A0ABW5NGW2_9SPHI
MAKQKKQLYDGVVYSTADDFNYTPFGELAAQETLPNQQQQLRVGLDKKARKGKVVTVVQGYKGLETDLEALAKKLKQRCGVGGGVKDGEILIQGDFKQKVIDLLTADNYKVKGFGG